MSIVSLTKISVSGQGWSLEQRQALQTQITDFYYFRIVQECGTQYRDNLQKFLIAQERTNYNLVLTFEPSILNRIKLIFDKLSNLPENHKKLLSRVFLFVKEDEADELFGNITNIFLFRLQFFPMEYTVDAPVYITITMRSVRSGNVIHTPYKGPPTIDILSSLQTIDSSWASHIRIFDDPRAPLKEGEEVRQYLDAQLCTIRHSIISRCLI